MSIRSYRSDYRKGEHGYEYTGTWYHSVLDAEALAKSTRRSFALLLLSSILYIVGLSFDHAAGRVFWILIPYVSMVFPLAYGWMGSVELYRFCRKQKLGKTERSDGRKKADSRVIIPKGQDGGMVRSEYEAGIRRPWRSAVALTVFSAAALMADVVMILRCSADCILWRELCFAAIVGAIFLLGTALMRHCGTLKKQFL